MQVRLIADDAIGQGQLRDADGLGFAAYAEVLAQAAMQSEGPLTVGVFGEWGSGKTSLMRLIQREVRRQPGVVAVWFNAWRYEQDQHPVIPLIGTIVREIQAQDPEPGREEHASALVRALRAVAYGFSLKSRLGLAGVAEVEASFDAKTMFDRYEALGQTPLLERSLFFEAFELLDRVRFSQSFRVVVFIDDLDRCFPDQAVRLLESIKLVLSQPGMVFVLGVARDVLEGYLEHRYATEYGVVGFRSHLYLDKVVQLAFTIPPSISRMGEFSRMLLAGQPDPVASQLASVLPLAGRALGGNPRAVIRFLNNLLVDLAVSSRESGHGPEIPIHFFAISRCLQLRWPPVFAALLASDPLAEELRGWDREAMRAAMSDEGPRGSLAARLIGDRQLEELLLGAEGQQWLADRDLRHASVEFLRGRDRILLADPEPSAGYDVLISFAPADVAEATRLGELLVDYGLLVGFWQPAEAAAGGYGRHSPAAGARAVLVCVGAGGQLDQQQRELIDLLGGLGRRQLIPTYLPGCGSEVLLPDSLSERQTLDLRGGLSLDAIRPMVDQLRAASEWGVTPRLS